jgi:hypothetical protein
MDRGKARDTLSFAKKNAKGQGHKRRYTAANPRVVIPALVEGMRRSYQ